MSPAQPEGIAWPKDGHLDTDLAEVTSARPLSLYVHVPFCSLRCGYCDFNTYTRGFGPGAEPGSYAQTVRAEAALARRVLEKAGWQGREARTVFIGGGTPTLLDAAELAQILRDLEDLIGIAEDAEITIEANPDSTNRHTLALLAAAGVTRVSFGMQSAVPSVLRTLERTHDPKRVPEVVRAAKEEGLEVSVDLIYGTPGESLDDWTRSLEAAIAMEPGHVSSYALVLEEGTKMGAMLARGELEAPDPDDEAAKYEMADRLLGEAGYRWYEISNFARPYDDEATVASSALRRASQHNLAYWRDHDWWGFGPGAHSHIGRYRWWNLKHPKAHAARLLQGHSPAAAGEILDEESRRLEKVMLAVRIAEGIEKKDVPQPTALARLLAEGLIDENALLRGRVVLTLAGRLLADRVTRALMGF